MISIRVAKSDADLAAWIEVRRRVRVNERLGYVTRTVSRTVERPL
jgi:hypothetical protein